MRLDCIRLLLETTKRKLHHELLLSIKNLQDFGAIPFPYIMHVLPRPLPSEVVKDEHFVLVDLLKLLPEGFSQAEAILETLIQPNYLPLVVHDPNPDP